MGLQWDKQPASRVIKTQTLAYTGSGTVVSTNFTSQTYQIRVSTQVTGYGEIDNLGTVITTATRDSIGFDIYTGQPPEYLCVTPGELFAFSSTSTSSGTINIAECA
jgi:hypothetical protein